MLKVSRWEARLYLAMVVLVPVVAVLLAWWSQYPYTVAELPLWMR